MAQNLTNDAAFQISRGAQKTLQECTEKIDTRVCELTGALEQAAQSNEKISRRVFWLTLIIAMGTLVMGLHAAVLLIQTFKH